MVDLFVARMLQTGQPAFDHGVGGLALTDDGATLLAGSGVGGGLQAWALGDGALGLDATWAFADDARGHARAVAVLDGPDGPVALFGSADGALVGHALGAAGGAAVRVPVTGGVLRMPADLGHVAGGQLVMADPLSGQIVTATMGAGLTVTGRVTAQPVALGLHPDSAIVLSADQARDGLVAYRSAPGGGLSEIAAMGPADGLWISGPTDLVRVQAYGRDLSILAGGNSHSLSVVELDGTGGLTLRDHLIDTLETRFESVQSLAVAQHRDRVFVIAGGGGDDGLALFTLLPHGQLLHLQSLAHQHQQDSLQQVTGTIAQVVDARLHVYATGAAGAGITHLEADLSGLGVTLRGHGTLSGGAGDDLLAATGPGAHLSGGAGDDILVSDRDTVMTGGAGADQFVFRDGTGGTITDFTPGEDRLDLSAWTNGPWTSLRSPDQLEHTATADGAQLGFGDMRVAITSSTGGPLGLADLFPGGFGGPDRMFFAPEGGRGDDGGVVDAPPPDPVVPGAHARVTLAEGRDNPALAGAALHLTLAQGETRTVTADAAGWFDLGLAPGEAAHLQIRHGAAPAPGQVTVSDALDALWIAIGLPLSYEASATTYLAADINRDGRITVSDAIDILFASIGLPTDAPPQWLWLDAARAGAITGPGDLPDRAGISVIGGDGFASLDMLAVMTGDVDGVL